MTAIALTGRPVALNETGDTACVSQGPAFVRASGKLCAEFSRSAGRTTVAFLRQQGGLRLCCPNVAQGCEAVIINTGGGVAGGDRASLRFEAGEGAEVTLTTLSAEKIYRSQDAASEIDVRLRLAAGARLEWLPQETILFDRSHLLRRLDADMAKDATLTIAESVVFGRIAMGEIRPRGQFRDRWRIRRDGDLVFAEELRLHGDIAAILDRPACGGGARMLATLVHIAPDAERQLEIVRAAFASGGDRQRDGAPECGASAWDGMLVARLAAASPQRLRTVLMLVLERLRQRPAPRVWQ